MHPSLMVGILQFFRWFFCDRRTTILRLFLLVGFSFFAYRFVNSDLWTFVNDEAAFLQHSLMMWRSRDFATHSPIVGTQGVHYGPTVIWIYGAVHALFGSDVETHIRVMLTLFTASNAAVAFAIGRLFGDRFIVPATMGIFVASSPYQFHWSRTCWDPLANICTGFVIALLCTKKRLSLGRSLAIGALIGLGVSTHPAMVPLSGVALIMAFWRSPNGRRFRQTSFAALVVLIINLPYLSYLVSAKGGAPSARRMLSMELLKDFFPEALRVTTLAGIRYFFSSEWPAFQRFSGFFAESTEMAALAVPWLAVVAALGLLLTLYWHRQGAQRIIALGAIVVWCGYVLFYSYLHLDRHPHYQYSIWWAMLVPLAGLLGWLRHHKRLFAVGVSVVWGISLFQILFIVTWVHFSRERGGTRDLSFGSPVGEQRRVIRQLCTHTQSTSHVVNQTNVLPISLGYIALTQRECAGKRLSFDGYTGALGPGEGRLFLRYAGPDTARLQVWNGDAILGGR